MLVKKDLVYVGSFALYQMGLVQSYRDIDIVVVDLIGLEGCIAYDSDSGFSSIGKRAFIKSDPVIDIFIENELPDFIEINGLKCQTLASMLKHYTEILPNVKTFWHKKIDNKIKNISSWMEKI